MYIKHLARESMHDPKDKVYLFADLPGSTSRNAYGYEGGGGKIPRARAFMGHPSSGRNGFL